MGKRKARIVAEGSSTVEHELRLAGQADALVAAFDTPQMLADDSGPDKATSLENCYFDTENYGLRAKGLAFRIRKRGETFVQTLKVGDNAQGALLSRGEYEVTLENGDLKPDALPKQGAAILAETARGDDLREIFKTRVERRTRRLQLHGDETSAARVEASLDLGEITTDAGSEPIAEIELELIKGRTDTLYQLALELQETGSFRLETRSKSSRAYDLLAGEPPAWFRGASLPLSRSDTVDETMTSIFAACFRHWLGNQAAALDGRDPEGVHQMRVGLRRLRSALSIFRKLIPEDQLAWLQPGAKAAINSLGSARDWDVFKADLLAPVINAQPDERMLHNLKRKAETRARQSYRLARKNLTGDTYTRFVLRFGQWLESRAWQRGRTPDGDKLGARSIVGFAVRTLKKHHGKALASGDDFADLPVPRRHELRIQLKKLRYATEFFVPLFDKKTAKPYVRTLKALQNDLGHLNDVAVAETLLADLLGRIGKRDDPVLLGRAAGLVIGWHAR
ncbi:MAG: CHAD domain-containing protein, partial [Geminicoccaceae bacterium]